MKPKTVLGKGLGALIPEIETPRESMGASTCPIDMIRTNPDQPRKSFDEKALSAMAETIREKGVLQPLLVRKVGNYYELIAGERRLRSAKMAGLTEVPVVIREGGGVDGLELAMIENLQREDLNPIEEANGYKEMLQRLNLTQEELAQRLGRDRSSIANMIRLLNLPKEIQDDLVNGEISAGHARALLGLGNEALQRKVAGEVKGKGLSVRETENIILAYRPDKEQRPRERDALDPDMQKIQDDFRSRLGAVVKIRQGKKGGAIQINYGSPEELDRIYSLVMNSLV